MELNIILAGVGGQGILSIAFVLDNAAMAAGYRFKQAEVHGMSQRGGAVQSHLRIRDGVIHSDIIPQGQADLVLAVEPLESLRYSHFLKPSGSVVTSADPFVNIPDYPDIAAVHAQVSAIPNHVLVPSASLARLAGSTRAQNMVMIGAASLLLPFPDEDLIAFVGQLFQAKGERIVSINQDAFRLGRDVAGLYTAGLAVGLQGPSLLHLCSAADPKQLDLGSLARWQQALATHPEALAGHPPHTLPISAGGAEALLATGQLP